MIKEILNLFRGYDIRVCDFGLRISGRSESVTVGIGTLKTLEDLTGADKLVVYSEDGKPEIEAHFSWEGK